MQVIFEKRAEVAFRSLNKIDQKKLENSVSRLREITEKNLFDSPNIKKIPGKNLFLLRFSPKYRAVLSLKNATLVIEDIFNRSSLEKTMLSEDI